MDLTPNEIAQGKVSTPLPHAYAHMITAPDYRLRVSYAATTTRYQLFTIVPQTSKGTWLSRVKEEMVALHADAESGSLEFPEFLVVLTRPPWAGIVPIEANP